MAQRYYTELRTSPMTLAGIKQHTGSVEEASNAMTKSRPDLSGSLALGSMKSQEAEDSKRAGKSSQGRQVVQSRVVAAERDFAASEGVGQRKSVVPSQLAMGSLSPGVERKSDGLNFGSSRRHFTSSSTDLFSPSNGTRGSRKRMQIERPPRSEGDLGMGIFPTDPRSSSNLQTDGNVAHLLHMLSAPGRGRFAAKKAIPASYSMKTLRRKCEAKEAMQKSDGTTTWMGRGLRTKGYSLPNKETGEWMSGWGEIDRKGQFQKLHTFDFVPRSRPAMRTK